MEVSTRRLMINRKFKVCRCMDQR